MARYRYVRPIIRRLSVPESDAARVRNMEAREQTAVVTSRRDELVVRTAVALRTSRQTADGASLELGPLEDAVKQYAILLKWLDTPPERALSQVLEVVRSDPATALRSARVVRESVVCWFLDAYYAA